MYGMRNQMDNITSENAQNEVSRQLGNELFISNYPLPSTKENNKQKNHKQTIKNQQVNQGLLIFN